MTHYRKNKERLSNILDESIGSKGKNVWISAPFFVDYGKNIHIGNNVEINTPIVLQLMLTDLHPLNNVHDDYTIKKGLHQNNLLTQPLFLYRIN